MNEPRRLAYMEAMGVDCYAPRLQLPGALASQLCAMPLPSAEQLEQPVAVAASAMPGSTPLAPQQDGQGRAAAMQALLADKPAEPTDRGADAVVAPIGSTQTARSQVPQFSLSIIRGKGILLIDEGLPGDINPAEYLQLLQNIVFAVGAGKQSLSIDAFVWPMSRSSQIDQSDTAARQALAAFIAKQIEQLNIRYILVMGDTAAQYLSEQALPLGELVQPAQLAAQLLRTRSAWPLLSDAARKRDVWQDLQPLYRSLKNN